MEEMKIAEGEGLAFTVISLPLSGRVGQDCDILKFDLVSNI